MEGRSHLIFGLTSAVVLDSMVHFSGPLITQTHSVALELIIKKAVFYLMVAFGTLLPDIDNARSTMGRKLGWFSKQIQHIAGHRTIFHSLLGLLLGSLIAIGLQQVVIYLLFQRGYIVPAIFIGASHLVLVAVLFGCVTHLIADGLTEGGVPLLWPNHKRFGFPPNPHWRFRTGSWQEHVLVYGLIILVGIGIWQSFIFI